MMVQRLSARLNDILCKRWRSLPGWSSGGRAWSWMQFRGRLPRKASELGRYGHVRLWVGTGGS
ncbi:MAG: hypothetical protein ACK56F_11395 [bacterium]